jgi:hypothetical protein
MTALRKPGWQWPLLGRHPPRLPLDQGPGPGVVIVGDDDTVGASRQRPVMTNWQTAPG